MADKKTGQEPPMFRLFDETPSAAPPSAPKVVRAPEALLESEKSRARQLKLLDNVANAFGWEVGKGYDPRMFPPKDWVERYHAGWAEIEQNFGPNHDPVRMTPRQKVEKRLYEPFAFSNNWDHLRRHDPENMRLVDAMVEEYGMCLYWDELNRAQHKLAQSQDRDLFRARTEAIDAVRMQVAAHYTQLLRERGYSKSEAKKILGGAVAGYMHAAKEMGLSATQVWPQKTDCPKEMMVDIDRYAHDAASRGGAYI